MVLNKGIATFTIWIFSLVATAQNFKNVGQIAQKIDKLGIVGSVMYMAAHPDDENQQFLSYMANQKKVRTAYLSLTRGDGGQNLIGTEQNEAVGLLRTHELLKARSVDGAEQFFTRALDFGYSKTTDEALAFWNKDSILYDVVFRIRAFQPDIIVTRFPPDSRAGHGHHSASAVLAMEGLKAAANPNIFPDQVEKLGTWQVKSVYWNFYNRGFTNVPPDDGDFVTANIGGYNALLGMSYPEIAAKARSQHRSQGFGAAARRGNRTEVFKWLAGEKVNNDLLENVNLSWNRYDGGNIVYNLQKELKSSFDFRNPQNSIPILIEIAKALEYVEPSPLLEVKKQEVKELIMACAGIHLEANAEKQIYTSDQVMSGEIEFVHQLPETIELTYKNIKHTVETNDLKKVNFNITLDQNYSTQPYWLKENKIGALYQRDLKYINLPFQKGIEIPLKLEMYGYTIALKVPLHHKYVDPAQGEIYRAVEVRPNVTVTSLTDVNIWNNEATKNVSFEIELHGADFNGELDFKAPKGWTINPSNIALNLNKKGEKRIIELKMKPSKNAENGELMVITKTPSGSSKARGLVEISYDHIPNQSYFPQATTQLRKLNVAIEGENVGYIMGAGDKVPEALNQLGFNVSFIDEAQLDEDLSRFSTIIVGIRAYNTLEWLPLKSPQLKSYMENGGRVVVQYQTSRISEEIMKSIAPYDLELSRSRVSEEDAEVQFLNTKHPILNTPNKITTSDFDGWIQERELYFGEKWDERLTPLLSMHDKGEDVKQGSLLYAKVGKGSYIYTGLSFFRELPAGVSGAYKLFANIVSNK